MPQNPQDNADVSIDLTDEGNVAGTSDSRGPMSVELVKHSTAPKVNPWVVLGCTLAAGYSAVSFVQSAQNGAKSASDSEALIVTGVASSVATNFLLNGGVYWTLSTADSRLSWVYKIASMTGSMVCMVPNTLLDMQTSEGEWLPTNEMALQASYNVFLLPVYYKGFLNLPQTWLKAREGRLYTNSYFMLTFFSLLFSMGLPDLTAGALTSFVATSDLLEEKFGFNKAEADSIAIGVAGGNVLATSGFILLGTYGNTKFAFDLLGSHQTSDAMKAWHFLLAFTLVCCSGFSLANAAKTGWDPMPVTEDFVISQMVLAYLGSAFLYNLIPVAQTIATVDKLTEKSEWRKHPVEKFGELIGRTRGPVHQAAPIQQGPMNRQPLLDSAEEADKVSLMSQNSDDGGCWRCTIM